MDKQKLLELLGDCNSGDIECDHASADELLLLFINDKDITAAFNKIDKWYA